MKVFGVSSSLDECEQAVDKYLFEQDRTTLGEKQQKNSLIPVLDGVSDVIYPGQGSLV